MRKSFPAAAVGCVVVIFLGLLIGGVGMLIHGINNASEEAPRPKQAPRQVPLRPGAMPTLAEARQGFTTNVPRRFHPIRVLEPPGGADVVDYIPRPPGGTLKAYQSHEPNDGQRHPAVVWAHAGFKGIDRAEWDKSAAFRKQGFIVFAPTYRGEHANRGNFEMFFGEVDDLLAAVDYVARLPFVDASHIYLVGHEEGGTLALLAAATGTEKVRTVFAIGGPADLRGKKTGPGDTPFPFPPDDDREVLLRSPQAFAAAICCPTFCYNAKGSTDAAEARDMAEAARTEGAPVRFVALRDTAVERATPLMLTYLQADTPLLRKIAIGNGVPSAVEQ